MSRRLSPLSSSQWKYQRDLMLSFTCEQCGEPLEAPESLASEPIYCPKCGAYRFVPNKSEAKPAFDEATRQGLEQTIARGVMRGVLLCLLILFGIVLALAFIAAIL